MKSLPRLFAVVLFPLLILAILAGCSGVQPAKTLTSIAVTPATPASLKAGFTQQFTATATFSDGSTSDITATVTWNSGTPATATISAAGLATGVAGGTTQITAAMSSVTSPGVTLTVIGLTSIAITPNPASVAVGATKQFTATGTYADASTADITTIVTWSSAPTSTATIGASTGLATGVANGTAQIFAQFGSIMAPSVTLTVGAGGAPVPVAVVIVQTNPTIPVSGVEDFSAKFRMSDGTLIDPTAAVTWSSGTTATATIIASSGIALGLAAGTSTITAASTGLISGTTTLTVVPAVPRFVYTVSPNDGVTSGFAINSSAGALAPLPALDIALAPAQLVFEPSGQFVYAAGGPGKIGTFVIDRVSGKLSASGLADVDITSFLNGTTTIVQSAVDPTGRYLYVLDGGTNFVNAYSIDTTNTPTKGTLTPIASSPTIATGASAAGIIVDPLGRFVYVTNFNDNSVSGYSIGADGGLSPLASIGPGPFTSLNGPELPVIDPAGQFLFVPNNVGNSVSAFTVAASGALTLIGSGATTTNLNAPFATAIDPVGKFLFVTNSGDGTIAVFPINSGGVLGAPTTTNTGLDANSIPEGVAIDASGSLLSVVNDGDNSVALFALANGVLTPKFFSETRVIPEFVSFYSGISAPAIGPSNVFAANSSSGNISGFTASNTTGVLSVGAGSPTAGIAGNTFLTADSTGAFLFNSSPSGKVFGGFSVTPSTAALSVFTGVPFSLTTSTDAPSEIATEPSSRFIFVADTTGNVVEPFSLTNPPVTIGATSSLTSVNTVVADPQGTLLYALGTNVINPILVSGFNGNLAPSGAAVTPSGTWTSGSIDPSGHWLVALDSAGKTLQSFKITPIQVLVTDGDLTAVGLPLATGVAAPSSVTFGPQGRFVFVSDATNGTVTTFSFNKASGAVSTTGKQTTVDATGTGRVAIDASGTFLYAAVKGNGTSVASGVAAYKINADGSLTAVAGSPFAAGASTSGTSGVVVTSSVQ